MKLPISNGMSSLESSFIENERPVKKTALALSGVRISPLLPSSPFLEVRSTRSNFVEVSQSLSASRISLMATSGSKSPTMATSPIPEDN